MNHRPRVFFSGEQQTLPAGGLDLHAPAADVLIVCGQGVYADGVYYAEFHDRDVYLEHALAVPTTAETYNYNVVVASGGFTQPRAPWLSEAESFLRMLADLQTPAPPVPIILDEVALDSAENLLLGLMTARLALGGIPIRRVGVLAAWQFKKWRFNRNAEALGIVERTYFHGLAPALRTNVQVPPDDARQPGLSEYREDSIEYSLLRTPDRDAKRRARWQNNRYDAARGVWLTGFPQGNPSAWARAVDGDSTPIMRYDGQVCSKYHNRLAMFDAFERTWAALGAVADDKDPRDVGLAEAFSAEVMKP